MVVEAVDGISVDHAREHVVQIGVGLDVIQLACLNQRAQHCPSVATTVAAGQQVALAAEWDGPDCALNRVGLELDATIMQEARQTFPARER
jgi:hypothetical protein